MCRNIFHTDMGWLMHEKLTRPSMHAYRESVGASFVRGYVCSPLECVKVPLFHPCRLWTFRRQDLKSSSIHEKGHKERALQGAEPMSQIFVREIARGEAARAAVTMPH
jgi:hypothetical protein